MLLKNPRWLTLTPCLSLAHVQIFVSRCDLTKLFSAFQQAGKVSVVQFTVYDVERVLRLKAHQTLPSKFRGSVITLRWIVCPVFKNESYFPAVHFAVVCGVRKLYEQFFSDAD